MNYENNVFTIQRKCFYGMLIQIEFRLVSSNTQNPNLKWHFMFKEVNRFSKGDIQKGLKAHFTFNKATEK